MLLGVDPLLSGELLKTLDEMGHGDQLLIADRNFPASATGRPVIRLGEAGALRTARAILSVFPLDTYVEHPLERMEVEDDASIVTPTQAELLQLAAATHPNPLDYGVIPRYDFYERARSVYAVVQCLEPAPYSCFILHKGVIND